MKGLRARIWKDPVSGDLRLLFYYDVGRITYYARTVDLEMRPVSELGLIPPTLTIQRVDAEGFLESLGAAIDGAGGPPRSWDLLVGKLEATKAHLRDLRHLLKLPSESSPPAEGAAEPKGGPNPK